MSHTRDDAHHRLESVLFETDGRGGESLPRANTTILDAQGHYRAEWRTLAQLAANDSIASWAIGEHSKRATARAMIELSPRFRDAVNAQWTKDQQAAGLLPTTSTPTFSETRMLPAKQIQFQNQISKLDKSQLAEMLTVLDESWEAALKDGRHGKHAEIAELDMKIKMVQGALGVRAGRSA